MKSVYDNFKKVFSDWRYILLSFSIMLIFGSIFYIFSNMDMTIGNLGLTYFIIEVTTQVLITILFAIFVPVSIYKIILFSDYSVKESSTSVVGAMVGVAVAGCPACSITLASYIGLAGVFSVFPFYGLELKVITVPILFWTNWSVLKKLNTCSMGRK